MKEMKDQKLIVCSIYMTEKTLCDSIVERSLRATHLRRAVNEEIRRIRDKALIRYLEAVGLVGRRRIHGKR